MEIYIIKKLWINPSKNTNAYGYSTIGYVYSKEETKLICDKHFILKSEFPWPLDYAFEFEGERVPLFISEQISSLDFSLIELIREKLSELSDVFIKGISSIEPLKNKIKNKDIIKINQDNKGFWKDKEAIMPENISFSPELFTYPSNETPLNELPIEQKDICLSCGKEWKAEVGGASCDCGKSNCIHYIKCSGCDKLMGYINDDDHTILAVIYCLDCIEKAKNKLINKTGERINGKCK